MLTRVQSLMACLLLCWAPWTACSEERSNDSKDPRSHWAFRPPVQRESSNPAPPGWEKTTIDRLIAQRHHERGLRAQPEASPETWIRRVSYDLIGLPPTAQQVQAFTKDSSEAARLHLIDALLDKPEFGERWGRHMMDLWRYSDWWGLESQLRYSQKHLWHWRDWIIESLNQNKGYDRMIIEMLAADEETPENQDALRATGFLCRSYYLFNRTTWLDEVVEHTGRAFLGLTFQCMKCHDHKYDPLQQTDYYRMRAIFEPYHVRLDAWPTETDFEKNGLPRVYDLHHDTPTYVHNRGDDKQPLTNQLIHPGIPLIFGEVQVKPVQLPTPAYFPGLRDHVLTDQLAAAREELQKATSKVASDRETLKTMVLAAQSPDRQPPAVKPSSAPTPPSAPILNERFKLWREDGWEKGDGNWNITEGGLVQREGNNTRCWIRSRAPHPSNFHAHVSLRILGGSMWKSVGLSFDVGIGKETLAYISASQDSKAQIALGSGKDYTYPEGALKALAIKTGAVHRLDLKVQGSLLNLSVDGEHAIAFLLPSRPSNGHLQLITFDAQAEFQDLILSTLPADAVLHPVAGIAINPVREAELGLAAAIAAQEAAEASVHSLRSCWIADRVSMGLSGRVPGETSEPTRDRDTLERLASEATDQHAKLQAKAALLQLELELLKAPSAKKAELETRLKKARQEGVASAVTNAVAGPRYSLIRGALKALEGPEDACVKNPAQYPPTSTGRRLALARWLASPTNPLTARVMVNQVWTRVFGDSFVTDVADFGRRAKPPLHQDLLDALSVDFMRQGWSLKALLRTMVSSRLYGSSSSSLGADPATLRQDPENTTYWRMNPKRLDAQALRDSLLQTAGLLDLSKGGPSIPIPASEDSHRRALYFQQHGELEHRFLASFDNASVFECYRRRESVTPQQALTMANSRLSHDCAIALEKSLISQTKRTAEVFATGPETKEAGFIQQAFLGVLGRLPSAAETEASALSLAALRASQPTPADPARPRVLFLQALMNHNDFITLR